jgi:hypothetical protein
MPKSLTAVVSLYLNSITKKWQVRLPAKTNLWTCKSHRSALEAKKYPGCHFFDEKHNVNVGLSYDFYGKVYEYSKRIFNESLSVSGQFSSGDTAKQSEDLSKT